MQLRLLLALVILTVLGTVRAWDKDDHEIFDLVAGLEAAEGKITFYDFLNTTKGATEAEISKAYRKRSLELHPDKNRGVKDSQGRFQRLGVIAQILRHPEKRARYDFFLKNGVPRWKGTGYLYSSSVQYLVMTMNAQTKRGKIQQLIQRAQVKAHGSRAKLQTVGQERKKIRMSPRSSTMVDDEGEDEGSSDKMTFIVEGSKVYLVDNGFEELLDESVVPRPAVTATWPIALLRFALGKAIRRRTASVPDFEDDEETDEATDALKPRSNGNANGAAAAAGKVAGRRRRQKKR